MNELKNNPKIFFSSNSIMADFSTPAELSDFRNKVKEYGFTTNPTRNGKLTKKYKKYVKSNRDAPLPNKYAFNPITNRIVLRKNVLDSRYKQQKVYKKSFQKKLVNFIKSKKTVERGILSNLVYKYRNNYEEIVEDFLHGFTNIKYLTNTKTLKQLYNHAMKRADERGAGIPSIILYISKGEGEPPRAITIFSSYVLTFEDFRDRVNDIIQGAVEGSGAIDPVNEQVIFNVYNLTYFEVNVGSSSDNIIFNCEGCDTDNNTCWLEVYKKIYPDLDDRLNNIKKPVCSCGEECIITQRYRDSKQMYACPSCVVYSKNLGRDVKKPVQEIPEEDTFVLSLTHQSNKNMKVMAAKLPQLEDVAKKQINMVHNTYSLQKNQNNMLKKFRERENITFDTKVRGKVRKMRAVRLLDEDIDKVYCRDEEGKAFNNENPDYTIIIDSMTGHADLCVGEPKIKDCIYQTTNGAVYYEKNGEYRQIMKYNEINKTNEKNDKLFTKNIFFDFETVIDWYAKRCSKPYSISYLVLSDEQLQELDEADEKQDKHKIKNIIKYNCRNIVGYDCAKKFINWIIETSGDHKKKATSQIRYNLISYNGSNFDNFILLEELLRPRGVDEITVNVDTNSLFYNGNQLLKFKINSKHTVFDLAKHLTGSLAGNCKGFAVKTVAKSSFNHHTAQKLHDEGKLIEFMKGNEELIDYNNRDVLSLAVIFNRYRTALSKCNKTCEKIASNLCDKATIGGVIWQVAQEHFKTVSLPQQEPYIETTKEQLISEKTGKPLKKFKTIKTKKFKTVNKKVSYDKLSMKHYKDILKYKCAGRVEMFNGVQEVHERICSLDVCSEYPYVMSVMEGGYYPCGSIVETDQYVEDKIGFYYCDIDQSILTKGFTEDIKTNLHKYQYENLKKGNLPKIYPYKNYKQNKDGSDGALQGNDWTHDKVLKDYFISTVMIEQLKKYGCKVDIKSGIYFTDKVKGCDLFEFLLDLMEKKNEQDLFKKNKDPKYNEALRSCYKLLSNGISGKVIEGLHVDKTECVDAEKYHKIANDKNTKDMTCINIIGSSIFASYTKTEESKLAEQRPVFWGVLVYDYAKCYMYDHTYSIVGLKNLLYTDTDATKCRHKHGLGCPKLMDYMKNTSVPAWSKAKKRDPRYEYHKLYDPKSKVYGSFENELEDLANDGVEQNYFCCVQKKFYTYGHLDKDGKPINPDSKDYWKMSAKGVPYKAVMLDTSESFISKQKNAKGEVKLTDGEPKFIIPEKKQKEAQYYFSEQEDKQVGRNMYDIFHRLATEKEAYVLTQTFRKCVKNSKKTTKLIDGVVVGTLQTLNNTVMIETAIKKITIQE